MHSSFELISRKAQVSPMRQAQGERVTNANLNQITSLSQLKQLKGEEASSDVYSPKMQIVIKSRASPKFEDMEEEMPI
jgi:hypothetical protein